MGPFKSVEVWGELECSRAQTSNSRDVGQGVNNSSQTQHSGNHWADMDYYQGVLSNLSAERRQVPSFAIILIKGV